MPTTASVLIAKKKKVLKVKRHLMKRSTDKLYKCNIRVYNVVIEIKFSTINLKVFLTTMLKLTLEYVLCKSTHIEIYSHLLRCVKTA